MRFTPLVLVLALAGPVAAADLVVRQRSATGPAGTSPHEETIYLTGDKVVSDAPAQRTIVDLDKKTITTLDKSKHGYTVTTFDELTAQMNDLKKQLGQLPPEARRMMGGLFEDGPPVVMKATGKTETIAGHPAKEYAVEGGPYHGSAWVTETIPTPPAFERWRALEAANSGPGKQLSDALSKIQGFPLRTRIDAKSASGTFVVSNEVIEVHEGAPPADVLAIPPGYTRRDPTAR
jgi:uncharacterized protein DUF4412